MNLTALQHSPFLQSLGWAIANSLWQSTVLWIAYYVVIPGYKNASAKFKNNYSTILLFSSFVWFCITLFTKYFVLVNQTSNNTSQIIQPNTVFINVANQSWQSILIKLSAVLPYLSVAYLLLLIFLGMRLVNSYRFTYYIKTNGLQKPGVEWKLFATRVAGHMGITKKIKLWVSENIDVPATIGFIKPVILIPLASINKLSEDQLEAIILHELSHIKRNDYLINLFISLIETILFFNPFIVLLSNIIKRERENCCDDFVIQYQYDRHSYASALLSLEQLRIRNFHLALTATSGKKQLLHRIKRIMEIKSNTNFNYGQKLLALLMITGVICCIAWLSPSKNEKKNFQTYKKAAKFSAKKNNKFETAQGIGIVKKNIKIIKAGESLQIKTALPENNIASNIYVFQNKKKENKNQPVVITETKKSEGANAKQNYYQYKSPADNSTVPDPLFYADENEHLPTAKSVKENTELNKKIPQRINIKKLQAEADKQQYSFSFDWDKLQDELKHTFNEMKLNTPPAHFYQNVLKENLEKLISNEIKNSDKKNLKRIPGAYALSKNWSQCFVDSLILLNTEITNGRIKKMQVKNLNNLPTLPVKICSVNTAPAGRLSYSITINNNSEKVNEPGKQRSPRHDNIRFEYKNNAIVINGKKIHLPDPDSYRDKMFALLKAKKIILSGDNDLIEVHVNE